MELEELSRKLDQEIGFFPVMTSIVSISKEKWEDFCLSSALNHHCSGAFSTKTMTAYINEGSKFKDLNVLHEFFGHGLFFEYHPFGKALRKIEQRNCKTTKEQLRGKLEPLSELFAIWCEFYFGSLIGLGEQFWKKYCLDADTTLRENLQELEKAREGFGLFGMFAMLGFPKYYDCAKIRNLMQMVYGKEKLNACRFGVLYGSRKPYSDIDLFVVSREIGDFNNSWLDIFSKTQAEFEKQLGLFAVSLRDPLFEGELVFGDRKYLEQARQQWLTQQITEGAIRFNFERYLDLRREIQNYPANSRLYLIARKYAESYLQNALTLRQGKRFSADNLHLH